MHNIAFVYVCVCVCVCVCIFEKRYKYDSLLFLAVMCLMTLPPGFSQKAKPVMLQELCFENLQTFLRERRSTQRAFLPHLLLIADDIAGV